MHNSLFAALVSFTVGTLALFILTLIFNRSLKIKITHPDIGKIKPIHFIGGVLGVVFVTSNIILMPFLGAKTDNYCRNVRSNVNGCYH